MSENEVKEKNPIYKKWWFWVIIAVLFIIIVGSIGTSSTPTSGNEPLKQADNTTAINNNQLSTDVSADTKTVVNSEKDNKSTETSNEETKPVSKEYQNALAKAESYSELMHMSKQGIYDQLTSEYGEKFPKDAAQYAVDNVKADWNANALAKAKDYQDTMNMSKERIYDQLTSEYGEKFTKKQAQYAIDHLDD